jgi:D-alanyl-D-alanine carboxypeptidase (penicillin-binding protein 5/6)
LVFAGLSHDAYAEKPKQNQDKKQKSQPAKTLEEQVLEEQEKAVKEQEEGEENETGVKSDKDKDKGKKGAKDKDKKDTELYKSAILMEYESGRIIYEKNMHLQLPPASMTKMMLMLVVMEKIKENKITLKDKITITGAASKIGGSQAYLKEGEVFTLEELMQSIAIHSSNDSCYAVSEYISGSTEGFVELMNDYAKELGMNDTLYHTVHGLPPATEDEEEDMTSAYDSAILAKKLVEYPELLKWTSTKEAPFREGKFIMRNTNKLIGTFPGADGLKTGFYSKAGFNLTATAKKDETRLISVVMGAPSEAARTSESKRLLSMGFNSYHKKVLLKRGKYFDIELTVPNGHPDKIKPIASTDLVVFAKDKEIQKLTMTFEPVADLKAPLKRDDTVGMIVAKIGEDKISSIKAYPPEPIPEANFFWKIVNKLFK